MNNDSNTIVRNLGKGMLIVLAANILSMLFNVLINLIQPKYLPVDTYAAIKTFTLYLSMIGLFHLGYEDGTYLRYGGKTTEEIDKAELTRNISTLRFFQLTVTLLFFLVGCLLHDNVFKIFAFILLPYNMTMHFKLFYQAVGEFKLYGRIMNCSTAILFVFNVLLIFVLHVEGYFWYLAVQIIVYIIIWVALEINLSSRLRIKIDLFAVTVNEFISNVKDGFFIMVGNFSSIFLTSMDRWFVKALLTSADFAAYSLAVSMEGFLTVAISPFTVTLYNYFCRENRIEHIKRIHNYMLLFASVLIMLAFPVKFILEIWLTNYESSVGVLFYLFASQLFFIIIKSIYVNLYKARKQQNKYFVKLVIVLLSGAVFNGVCYYFMRVKEAMAIGTLMSALLWFVLCQYDFKELIYDFKHLLYLAIEFVAFLIIGNQLNAIIGFLLYGAITVIASFILVRDDVRNCFNLIKNILVRRTV